METENQNFHISYQTKGKLPSLPFVELKNEILGLSYTLSLACVSRNTATRLNQHYRQKDYTPNILSFSLTKHSGELILHLPTIKKQYPAFEMSHKEYILYLFIHGCLHLRGLDHGTRMEALEEKYKNAYTQYIT